MNAALVSRKTPHGKQDPNDNPRRPWSGTPDGGKLNQISLSTAHIPKMPGMDDEYSRAGGDHENAWITAD